MLSEVVVGIKSDQLGLFYLVNLTIFPYLNQCSFIASKVKTFLILD